MKVSEKWGTDVDTAVELALQELNASKKSSRKKMISKNLQKKYKKYPLKMQM